MIELNLKDFNPQLKKINDELYIFDPIRKKYLLLTPEEWVRQNFVQHLIKEYQYPATLIRLEGGLKYDQRPKRSDILVYNRLGEPFLLVECKAMQVPLNQVVMEQVSQYNYVIQAQYVAITNGIHLLIYEPNYETTDFKIMEQIPIFT
ncbi:MAG: type I restriction enzyme HsdR N-terminal domain-containing protein [Microscillaceae bacterium]|jgi:hypothetical protein|nr:type I restriction enzyme HsdR N-terminal domain-containing protein [Microscillaceae bacterium]